MFTSILFLAVLMFFLLPVVLLCYLLYRVKNYSSQLRRLEQRVNLLDVNLSNLAERLQELRQKAKTPQEAGPAQAMSTESPAEE